MDWVISWGETFMRVLDFILEIHNRVPVLSIALLYLVCGLVGVFYVQDWRKDIEKERAFNLVHGIQKPERYISAIEIRARCGFVSGNLTGLIVMVFYDVPPKIAFVHFILAAALPPVVMYYVIKAWEIYCPGRADAWRRGLKVKDLTSAFDPASTDKFQH